MARLAFVFIAVVMAAQLSRLEAKAAQNTLHQKLVLHKDKPKKVDLNQPMPLKAQEQGYSGKQVQHVDMKTQIGDWQKEYGPNGAGKVAHHHSGSFQGSAVAVAIIGLS